MICDTPLDCFELLFGEKLIDFIVEEMNSYREQRTSSVKPNRDSHKQDGLRRIVRKYSCFLAVIMLMTITRKYKIHDNWSTNPLISTSMFGQGFARDRSMTILRYLHFNNDSKGTDEEKLDKIKSVRVFVK